MEQARQKYETTLPQLLAVLQQQHRASSPTSRHPPTSSAWRTTIARYVKWDLQRKRIAEVTQEALGAQGRQQAEQQRRSAEFAKHKDDLFKEKVPDLA